MAKKITAAVVCATMPEYRHCRDTFAATGETRSKGRLTASGGDDNLSIRLVHGGIGKANAASATQLAIDLWAPDVVIDAGAAGSLDQDKQIGSVVCGVRCFEYDIVPLDQFERFARDLLTSTMLAGDSKEIGDVMSAFATRALQLRLVPALHIGHIVAGEQDVSDGKTRQLLREKFNGSACDWETAAVLRVAMLNTVGSLSFRVITDNADEQMMEHYQTNLHQALDNLARVLKLFLLEGFLHKIFAK